MIKEALDGKYTVGFIAKKLGITERQVKRLKKAVREEGAEINMRETALLMVSHNFP
ncbi:helix-turn-helix domain-containing protein [Breznakiellaceae bacterium SP9]